MPPPTTVGKQKPPSFSGTCRASKARLGILVELGGATSPRQGLDLSSLLRPPPSLTIHDSVLSLTHHHISAFQLWKHLHKELRWEHGEGVKRSKSSGAEYRGQRSAAPGSPAASSSLSSGSPPAAVHPLLHAAGAAQTVLRWEMREEGPSSGPAAEIRGRQASPPLPMVGTEGSKSQIKT